MTDKELLNRFAMASLVLLAPRTDPSSARKLDEYVSSITEDAYKIARAMYDKSKTEST